MSQQYQIHTVRLNSNESYHPTKSGSPIERRSITYHQPVKQIVYNNQQQQSMSNQVQNSINLASILKEKLDAQKNYGNESQIGLKTQKSYRSQSTQTQFLLSDLPKLLYAKNNEEQLKLKIQQLEAQIQNMKKTHSQEISTLKCLMSNSFLEETNSQPEIYIDYKQQINIEPTKFRDFDKQIIQILQEYEDTDENTYDTQDKIIQSIQQLVENVKQLDNQVQEWKITCWNLQKQQPSLKSIEFDEQIDFITTKKKGELIFKLKQQGIMNSDLCIPEEENDCDSICIL